MHWVCWIIYFLEMVAELLKIAVKSCQIKALNLAVLWFHLILIKMEIWIYLWEGGKEQVIMGCLPTHIF